MGTVGKGGRADKSLELWPRVKTNSHPNKIDIQSYGRIRVWSG